MRQNGAVPFPFGDCPEWLRHGFSRSLRERLRSASCFAVSRSLAKSARGCGSVPREQPERRAWIELRGVIRAVLQRSVVAWAALALSADQTDIVGVRAADALSSRLLGREYVMLQNVSEAMSECHRRAEECRQAAILARNLETRDLFLDLERRWLKLAESYGFVDRVSQYLDFVESTVPSRRDGQ
jgi:hypothetical protein